MYDAREPSITGSRRSGGSHRSVSSTLSKLREAELDLQQSKLQMEQELTEEEYRREEQSQLDRIELARKKRQLQNELDQKALRASTLQAQAADLLEEDDDAGSFRGWPGLNSNLTSSAPNITTSSSMMINTPLRPPSRSFMNTPFMKQIRGFGDRVIKAMTPRNTNSIVDGLAPQTSSYSSSTTIPNRTNLNTVSSTVGQALFGAPPLLINSRPVVSTTTTTASTQLPSARPPPTQPPPVTAGSALFGAPPPSSGPATYSTPNPFTSHGPAVFGAPPVSSISTIYNRPPPPVSSGPAVFGAPPRDHTPPPFTAGQALFGAPSSTHIQQRTSWSATPSPTNPFIGGTTAPEVDPFIPDEWINNITANAPAIRNGIRPPKLDLPYFDGNPMDYPMFIQSFKVQIHDTCTSDAERQRHLKNCLSKEIQQRLGQALLNPGLYHYALTELHRKYGHPRIISTACATALASLQSFRDNDFKALSLFSSTLHSVVATLQLGGYGAELHSSSTLSQLVQKLPPALRSRWAEKSYLIECRLPNIADLDTWLDDVTTAEYCVRAGQSAHPSETNHPASGDRKSSSINNNKKKRDGPRTLATS